MSVPIIKEIKSQEYTVKQSKYENVGKLPTRAILAAPSGGGKTNLLVNLLIDVYRGCFSRIYIMSPSIHIDRTWDAVKDYIRNEMKIEETDDDKFYYETYQPDKLAYIINTQHKIIEYMKKHKMKNLYQIIIIIDDFADSPVFTRQSKLLHQLYIRGRHDCISTITSTQRYYSIAPIVRLNATQLYVFRLRNYKDMESIIEELSAIYDKKTLLNIYNIATEKPFSFLFVNLMAHNKQDMFFINFQQKIMINDN